MGSRLGDQLVGGWVRCRKKIEKGGENGLKQTDVKFVKFVEISCLQTEKNVKRGF